MTYIHLNNESKQHISSFSESNVKQFKENNALNALKEINKRFDSINHKDEITAVVENVRDQLKKALSLKLYRGGFFAELCIKQYLGEVNTVAGQIYAKLYDTKKSHLAPLPAWPKDVPHP